MSGFVGNGTQKLDQMDTLTIDQRSERMSRIRGKDMKPELSVRRVLISMSYGFRLHRKICLTNLTLYSLGGEGWSLYTAAFGSAKRKGPRHGGQ